jgi:hypothetical protein
MGIEKLHLGNIPISYWIGNDMNLEELTKQYDFSDRVVVVTGGAGILGGEIACALAGCNAKAAALWLRGMCFRRTPWSSRRTRYSFNGGESIVL